MNKALRLSGVGVLAAFWAAGCGGTGEPSIAALCGPDPAVASAIGKAWKDHVQAHLARDPVGAAAIYDDDVWWRWEGGLDLRGRSASEDAYRHSWYPQFTIVEMAYTSDEVLVCADAAHEVGRFTMVTDVGGKRDTTTDHYMILWRKQADGSWRVLRGAGSALPKVP